MVFHELLYLYLYLTEGKRWSVWKRVLEYTSQGKPHNDDDDDDNADDDDGDYAIDVAACGNSTSHQHVYICDCHSHAGDDVRWMSWSCCCASQAQ